MHCDITGFTTMSESLQGLGREGAELMASVLNRFFDTMLGVADGWGGVQMKFGGDAMLLYFEGDEGPARAAACGLEMQSRMPEFRHVEVAGSTYLLRMRIGIHAGRFFSASVGNPDGLLHYVLLGHDVNESAAVEAAAEPGQVVTTKAAADAIASVARTSLTANGVWRVRTIEAQRPVNKDPGQLEVPSELLARYILPPLAEAFAAGRADGLPAEQRRVTSMFINVLGTTELLERAGEQETLRQVNEYTNMVLSSVTRHGGVLLGSDVADHGDKFILLFGAPVLVEEHEASALRCAHELSVVLRAAKLDLQHQIGINSGSVFAGEIGSRNRREYTVIGDTVNLAARLMAAAKPGQTFVSGAAAKRAGDDFNLTRLRPIRVKGKSEPIQLFRLEGVRSRAVRGQSHELPLSGREDELALLMNAAANAQRGEAAWCFVSGDAGAGKTRITDELVVRLAVEGWRPLHALGRAHTSSTPFGAWAEALRALLGITSVTDGALAWRALQEEIAEHAREFAPFAAILGELLGLPVDDDPMINALAAQTRRERLTSMIVEMLRSAANRNPVVLAFEDAQWCDSPSLELLAEVLSRVRAPILVAMTSRERSLPGEIAVKPLENVPLAPLSDQASRALLVDALGGETAFDAEAIIARAQGNPLFLLELARSASTSGEMPETVHDVVLVRLDALPHDERSILRLASVIGPTFDLAALKTIGDRQMDAGKLPGAVSELVREGFIQPGERDAQYAFAHALTREVAYETLLFADRRALHRRVASHLEEEHAGALEQVCETLLHHYGLARDWARSVLYGTMSGDRASAIFANNEALQYYERSIEALSSMEGNLRADRSVLLERVGDSLDTAGRHREAADSYVGALGEWRSRGTARRPRFVPQGIRPSGREALLCRKVAVSYERRSEYDQSLEWIEQALQHLPARAGSVAAEVCASKSVTLFRKGLYKDGMHWGRRALSLARRSGERRIIAYAHNMLATSYIEQGALKQAVKHLVASQALYRELQDLKGQAAAGNNLGSCYQLLGNMDGALEHYQLALEADARLGNVTHAAIIHNNIGEVLLILGRITEAEEHLREVLTTYAAGNANLAALAGLSEVNLSRCALVRGDTAEAERRATRGMRLLRQVGAQGLLDEADLQFVEVRIAQARWKNAIERCSAVLYRARQSGARLLEARGGRLMGVALWRNGDADAALPHLQASAALARKLGANSEEAYALLDLAACLVEGGRLKAATRPIARGLRLFEEIGAARQISALRALQSRVEEPLAAG